MSESRSSGVPASGPVRPAEQRARWARLLSSVFPSPDGNRLVTVAEVQRGALPLTEGSLAEAGIPWFVQEIATLGSQPRFRILVAARDRSAAAGMVVGF